MGITVKITTLLALEMGNFTQLRLVKFVPFPIQHSWYLSQVSLLPMLLHILIIHIIYIHIIYIDIYIHIIYIDVYIYIYTYNIYRYIYIYIYI